MVDEAIADKKKIIKIVQQLSLSNEIITSTFFTLKEEVLENFQATD